MEISTILSSLVLFIVAMASLSPSFMTISFAAWPGVTVLGVGVIGSPEESAFLYDTGRVECLMLVTVFLIQSTSDVSYFNILELARTVDATGAAARSSCICFRYCLTWSLLGQRFGFSMLWSQYAVRRPMSRLVQKRFWGRGCRLVDVIRGPP